MERIPITVQINGQTYQREVEPRLLLVDLLRDEIGLTGTHIGCEEGICGACTVEVNGETVKSCMLFAVQADGARVLTVEGLSDGDQLHPVQQGFHECYALQCGYCTPGMLISANNLLACNANPTEGEIRTAMVGNLCRCTGYQDIVKGVKRAAELIRSGKEG